VAKKRKTPPVEDETALEAAIKEEENPSFTIVAKVYNNRIDVGIDPFVGLRRPILERVSKAIFKRYHFLRRTTIRDDRVKEAQEATAP